jgi:hypothetical protein
VPDDPGAAVLALGSAGRNTRRFEPALVGGLAIGAAAESPIFQANPLQIGLHHHREQRLIATKSEIPW